jgi:hypothetical protein
MFNTDMPFIIYFVNVTEFIEKVSQVVLGKGHHEKDPLQ